MAAVIAALPPAMLASGSGPKMSCCACTEANPVIQAATDATDTSQAAGAAFLKRFRLRRENRDPEVNEKVAPAQSEALSKWGAPREKPYEYLNAIQQPTLVINGDHDVIVYTINSYILQQNLPNAELILFPDSNHGSHFQFTELFNRYVTDFIDR